MKKIVFVFVIFSCLKMYSQDEKKIEQQFPIHITVMNESISFPDLSFLSYSYNPAFIIGTEYLLKKKAHSDWHIAPNLGYYFHKDWQTAIFLNAELGYRYRIRNWSVYPRLGLGYCHAFTTKANYKFKEGKFQKSTDYGTPLFMTSFGLNIAYKLGQKEQGPEIYITYTSAIEWPFNAFNALHHFVGVGYKFYPFNK